MWGQVAHERSALAAVLRGLTQEQWDAPSLCDGWRIRDVAAHVIAAPQVTVADVAAELRDRVLRRHPGPGRPRPGDRDVSAILADYEALASARRRPVGTTADDMLVDVRRRGDRGGSRSAAAAGLHRAGSRRGRADRIGGGRVTEPQA